MNYSLITPEILENRLKSLPSHIQEIVTSEQIERLVMQIGRSHYLSRDKVQVLQQMVALVLLGVMNLRDLKQEMSEKLFLNYAHTVALAHELDEEIFNPIRGDLEQIYTPLEEEVATEEVGAPEKPISEIKTFVEAGDFEPLPDNEVGEPVIIHKENMVAPLDPNRATKFADLSKSFSFFRKEEIQAPATARVETTKKTEIPSPIKQVINKIKKEEEKTINYNELKTPVSEPFSNSDFINLEAFDTPHTTSIGSINQPTEKKEAETAVLQGNHIDLRPKTI
jgi:hypothetical protein